MYEEYLKLLKEFVSFKSISTDIQFKDEINNCVEWLKKTFKNNQFESIEAVVGYGNPIIIASYIKDPSLPTCLIYGHYDVQPANIKEGWNYDPFKLSVDNERIYARGVVDNKGQVMIHMASVFNLIRSGAIKYNIKFIIEGDEESGSEKIENFFKDHSSKLISDLILVSDGELTSGYPTLDTSFRGIINFTLKVITSTKDNHSGLYGGSIPNAANELVKILSKFHDDNGNLTIPGIDNGKSFSEEILLNNKSIPYSKEEFKKITGAKIRFNDEQIDLYTQVGNLTSAEITSLNSGYLEDGYRNAIPREAYAKINFRLAPELTYEKVDTLLRKYLDEITPKYLDYKLKTEQFSNGIIIDSKNKFTEKAIKILKEVYLKPTYFKACGAIIPIAGLFNQYLKVPIVMIGLGNEDCNMHGANENFEINTLQNGLNFSYRFLSE